MVDLADGSARPFNYPPRYWYGSFHNEIIKISLDNLIRVKYFKSTI